MYSANDFDRLLYDNLYETYKLFIISDYLGTELVNSYSIKKVFASFYITLVNKTSSFADAFKQFKRELKDIDVYLPEELNDAIGVEQLVERCITNIKDDKYLHWYRTHDNEGKAVYNVSAFVHRLIEEEVSNKKIFYKRYNPLNDTDSSQTVVKYSTAKTLIDKATKFIKSIYESKEQHSSYILTTVLATVMQYLPMSNSMSWGVGQSFYTFAKNKLNCVLECYASPFNNSLDYFCSIFKLDFIYGSVGSFYDDQVIEFLNKYDEQISIIANPPFIETEMARCINRIVEIGKKCKNPLIAIIVFPYWNDPPTEGLIMAKKLCFYSRILRKRQYSYYDYTEGSHIVATFPSIILALQFNDAKTDKMLLDRLINTVTI